MTALRATWIQDGRVSERRAANMRATAQVSDGGSMDVMVQDLSVTGCAIRDVPQVPVGAVLTLGLSGVGIRRAAVVRNADGIAGCRFERPLTASELEQALTASQAADPRSGVVGVAGDDGAALSALGWIIVAAVATYGVAAWMLMRSLI